MIDAIRPPITRSLLAAVAIAMIAFASADAPRRDPHASSCLLKKLELDDAEQLRQSISALSIAASSGRSWTSRWRRQPPSASTGSPRTG